VATTGPLADPADLGSQPANVRVERFIPQDELLPGCALVASHAGSGTFLGALAHGLPQLLLPQAADQFLNATAAAQGGVGVVVTPEELTVASVREAALRVLGDASFAERAGRVADEIAAMPTPEEAAAALERRFAPGAGSSR
jgi:UDP:flavonoid glycosyltransferase YjiC (YdhE family)